MISSQGKTQLAGRAAAQSVFDALIDMAQRCESAVDEVELRREAYALTIAMRTDGVGANEANIQSVCAALEQATSLCVFGHDEDSFWLEVTVPDVFEADAFDPAPSKVSIAGEKRGTIDYDAPADEWLVEAMRAVKEDRDQLAFEDFAINKDRFFLLADLYGAFKHAAGDAAAEFVFKQPDLPKREHGSCYLVAEKLVLQKEVLQALFPLIAQASSFGIDYCADDRVRLGVEVSNIYDRRQ